MGEQVALQTWCTGKHPGEKQHLANAVTRLIGGAQAGFARFIPALHAAHARLSSNHPVQQQVTLQKRSTF
jgi:hypothetical protein